MTRDGPIRLLEGRDPLEAVRAFGIRAPTAVRVAAPAQDGRLVDAGREGAIDDHRAAHSGGRRSEAVVAYGDGVPCAAVADRLLALGELSRETGMLVAVTPVPSEGSSARPGSWGVEDLVVIAAARGVIPGAAIRPSWETLGAPAAQVALAFGATEWAVPEGDDTDLDRLARAAGCAVTR